MDTFPKDVMTLAKLIGEHRVVPFLGAGCSAAQLRVDWNGVARLLSPPNRIDLEPIDAASGFVEREGRSALMEVLGKHFIAQHYDAEQAPAAEYVAAMGFHVMYTTNQDNLIELCFAARGRPLNVVVGIAEIATQNPSAATLYKYHGDLGQPDSVVFTRDDYEARMTLEATLHHPMEVRLRSECLSKSLLFIGYSLRDPNVRLLLGQLRATFRDRLPQAYLLQYLGDARLAEEIHDEYGVRCLDPASAFPDIADPGARFLRFMGALNRCVVEFQAGHELESVLDAPAPQANRVVTRLEQDALDHALTNVTSEHQISRFRATYDLADIPTALVQRAVEQFIAVCRNARGRNAYGAMKAAYFNFVVRDIEQNWRAFVAVLALANELPPMPGLAMEKGKPGTMHCPLEEQDLMLVSVAEALMLLKDWDREISKGMYDAIAYWNVRLPGAALTDDDLATIRQAFSAAYARGRTTYENPLDRALRLKDHPKTFRAPSVSEVHDSITANFAKRFQRPPNI